MNLKLNEKEAHHLLRLVIAYNVNWGKGHSPLELALRDLLGIKVPE